jgi:hypothetical protein
MTQLRAAALEKDKPAQDQDAKEEAKEVAHSWMAKLARFGYGIRGLLYIAVGLLAFGLVLGVGGSTTDKHGALAAIGDTPFGKILLVLIVVGLAGYSLWGFVRAFLDQLDKGNGPKGLVTRAGYLVSALTYGALILPAVRLLLGSGQSSDGTEPEVLTTAWLMSFAYGQWLVGIAGVVATIGGLGQFYQALTADFCKDLKRWQMSNHELESATRVGRFGHTARGVVFTMVGLFIVQAALTRNPNEARGLDETLLAIAQQPYGPWLLGVVALGLVSFGIYSILASRWVKIPKK